MPLDLREPKPRRPAKASENHYAWLTLTLRPQALVITRTTARPFAGQDGKTGTGFLGRQMFLSQLNAAVRRVSRQLQIPMLDYELMSSALGYGEHLDCRPLAG
jgi:hypothetical protein